MGVGVRKERVEFGGVTSTQFIDLFCITMKSRKLPVQPPPFLVTFSTSLLSVSLVFLSLARQSRGTFGGHGAPNQSAVGGKGQSKVKEGGGREWNHVSLDFHTGMVFNSLKVMACGQVG